jgi:hypothetical protein
MMGRNERKLSSSFSYFAVLTVFRGSRFILFFNLTVEKSILNIQSFYLLLCDASLYYFFDENN